MTQLTEEQLQSLKQDYEYLKPRYEKLKEFVRSPEYMQLDPVEKTDVVAQCAAYGHAFSTVRNRLVRHKVLTE